MLSVVFYFTVFAIVFLIQAFAIKQKNPTIKRILAILSFLPILLLMGLRHEVGTDWIGHVDIYKGYENMSFSEIWARNDDIGSKLIIGLSPYIFNDYKAIFWIYGLLTLYPIYRINKNYGFKYLAYSTLVFNLIMLPESLNIMRQCAAAAFALLAFDCFKQENRKLPLTFFYFIIALALHTSALLMAPFFVLYYFTNNKKRGFCWTSILLSTFIAFSLTTILKSIFIEIGYAEYDHLLVTDKEIGMSISAILFNLIQYIILFLLYILYKNNHKNKPSTTNDIKDSLSMVFNGTIFELAGTATKYLSRISYYFSIYQITLIPIMLQNITNKQSRIIAKVFCISSLATLFIIRYYFLGYCEIIPYQTWLFT